MSHSRYQHLLAAAAIAAGMLSTGCGEQADPRPPADLEFWAYTHATWLPTGDAILCESHRDGGGVYLASLEDGSTTRFGDSVGHPRFSPDGEWIVHERLESGNSDIYKMHADGSDVARLTDDPATDMLPFWSPDASRVGFNSSRDGNLEIYVMDGDGSGVTRLTHNDFTDMAMSWSPDGKRIVFHSNRDGSWDLYSMAVDGGDVLRLTNHSATDRFAVWSPDGTDIAFTSMRDGDSEIYLIDADGSNLRRLTRHPANDTYVMWSPDGAWLSFQSDRAGGTDVYIVPRNGGNPERVTYGQHFLDYVDRYGLDPARALYARWKAESQRGFMFYRSVMSRRGYDLLVARRHEEAAGILELTIDRYPRSTHDHLLLAKAFIELERRDSARNVVEQILGREPDNAVAAALLAHLGDP